MLTTFVQFVILRHSEGGKPFPLCVPYYKPIYVIRVYRCHP